MGRMGYRAAYALQCALLEQRRDAGIPDTLLLLEHPHVYTLGRRGQEDEVLVDKARLRSLGAELISTDRGGQTTYHGPGQLVGYPIIDLKSARMGAVQYVRMLEQVLIQSLERYGISGHTVEGKTGVWTLAPNRAGAAGPGLDGWKIVAIGVRIRRGITMHGFALNVTTDLSYFRHIVPCGMKDLPMASIASLRDARPPVEEVARQVAGVFARTLGRRLACVSRSELAA